MSSIFRGVLVSKRLFTYTSSSNILRFTFDIPSTVAGNCKCKTLKCLSSLTWRNYSVSNQVTPVVNFVKDTSNDENMEEKLIYNGSLSKFVRLMKVLTLFTSAAGISIQPIILMKVYTNSSLPSSILPLATTIAIFAFLTPILLHTIVKRYILEIRYTPKNKKYIATVCNFFGVRRKVHFTPEDVTIPAILGIFTTCTIKKSPVFIDVRDFYDAEHYIKIMGFDKPLDIMDESNECSKTK